MKHTYWSPLCLVSLPRAERTWSHPRKIFDADCTTSYVLNSGVTKLNITKFLQDVQKWLLITTLKSKLQSSNLERQSDEWRSSSNCGQTAANIARFNSVNSEIIGQKFTKLVHDVARLLPLNLLEADLRSANPLSNAKAKSKGRSARRLRTSPKFKRLP